MFENLTGKIEEAVRNFKGLGKITEDNISETIRMVRLALLEADVNYQVVKEFIAKVKEKTLGMDVQKSLKPEELFLKILKEELLAILGDNNNEIIIKKPVTVAMLVGLQGSGKTTTVGKLGLYLRKKQNCKPMFIAADIYRPAAIKQLQVIGKELGIPVYEEGQKDPLEIVTNGLKYAKDNNYDYVLIDTAGRLQIDEKLMDELHEIKKLANPNEILLILDSMMGQDAINVIQGFNEKLPLTGAILTKFDGDTKGGVALSVRHLTNIPIKFLGISEKSDGLMPFDSQRIVNRLLGMGDILSIIEKAEEVIDKDLAKETAKKMHKGNFNLEDFLTQLNQLKKMGPLENILKMLPGASKMGLNNVSIDPKQMARIEAIIKSMTPKERKDPDIIKASRKIRIAKGSGTTVNEVNKLLNQFEQMKKMLKMMQNKNFKLPL